MMQRVEQIRSWKRTRSAVRMSSHNHKMVSGMGAARPGGPTTSIGGLSGGLLMEYLFFGIIVVRMI